MTRPSWVALRAWLSFIELDKAVVLVWLDWLVFCEYGVSVSALWCPLATPTILLGFLLPWAWSISSWLLQQSAATAPYLEWGVSPHHRPSWPKGRNKWASLSSFPDLGHMGKRDWRGLKEVSSQASKMESNSVLQFIPDIWLMTKMCHVSFNWIWPPLFFSPIRQAKLYLFIYLFLYKCIYFNWRLITTK